MLTIIFKIMYICITYLYVLTYTIQLIAGSRLYSTVYAYNAAGLKSEGVTSDGYIIDSTPPFSFHKFQLGSNKLKNPSFEEGVGSEDGVPKEWKGHGKFLLTTNSGNIKSQDGQTYTDIVSGYIEQTLATVKTKRYRVIFHVRSPDTVRFHSQQLGFVQLPGFHAAFFVKPTVATSGESWQKHVYYFIASNSMSTARIGAVGHKTGFLLDSVSIQEINAGRRSPSTDPRDPANSHVQPMHVHLNSRGRYTALTAAWDVEDPESPVTNYYWAIGTVRGA